MRDNAPVGSGDWRKSYAHVFALPPLGCAWEFLRRNPRLAETWPGLEQAWQETRGEHGLRIIRDMGEGPSQAPCQWASSLNDDAATAPVIWSPNSTSHVLKTIAVPPRASAGGHILDLEFVSAEKTVFLARDGSQQLLFRDGPRSLQLSIQGSSITEPTVLLVDTAIPDDRPGPQLDLLRTFTEFRRQGTLPDGCIKPHPYAKRAAAVLVALDGYLAGVPHRDIAVAMFGEMRVDRDWSDSGENLRDTVRRAVARGVALMEGGYRIFLH